MKVAGWVRVPGDKSITHRALLLAAMAPGRSYLGSPLTSADARSTARVLRQLGARISPLAPGRTVQVAGRGRLGRPDRVLHCGNSGTTARLVLGLLAAHRFRATLTGDASLRRRPMRRVTLPLATMGARFTPAEPAGLPLEVRGGTLQPLHYEMPVSSAQIKSALLLAGYAGQVGVTVKEPGGRSRDHTEVMFRGLGLSLAERDGWIEYRPGPPIAAFAMQIPGDISSAAFLVGAALLAEGGEVGIHQVGVNPTRTGFLSVLSRMGADIDIRETGLESGEPVGELVARAGVTRGTEVGAGEIPGIIDEIPMLAVVATRVSGVTRFREAGELRVKESDRLGLLAANIRAVGGHAAVEGNDLVIEGSDRPPRGRVTTEGDHRLAMAFAVLGTVSGATVKVDDMDCAGVSFPGFRESLRSIRVKGARG